MTEQQTNRNAVIVPLLAGMLGTAIGLLLAPRSGRETRNKVRGSAQDIKQQAQGTISAAKEEFGTELEHARRLKHKVAEVIKTKGQSKKSDIADEIQDQKDTYNNWDREV